MAYAVITEVFVDSYDVSCGKCLRHIGRMSKDELSHAIKDKGEVVCFECDLLTCNSCKGIWYYDQHAESIAKTGMCSICYIEAYDNEELEDLAISSLWAYEHKSIEQDTTAQAALARIKATWGQRSLSACLLGQNSPRNSEQGEKEGAGNE